MFTIISYDVTNDRQRTRVRKLLKGYGTRVQYSVFECYLTEAQLTRLRRQLRPHIDTATDSVRIYRLDATAVRQILVLGSGQVTADEAVVIIGR